MEGYESSMMFAKGGSLGKGDICKETATFVLPSVPK